MRIDKRLTIIGILLIVLSMTMATQYATTRIAYEYNIVHPSNADIRFVACDNSSDNITVLRLAGTNGTNVALKLHLGGNFSAGYNKTYTAAFAIVNEEAFKVNITRINVSTSAGDACLQIWLHKNRTKRVENDDGSVFMWDKTVSKAPVASPAWVLGAGNGNPNNINGTSGTTPWTNHGVRFTQYKNAAVNGSSDFVWVQISVDVPLSPTGGAHTGLIWIHFEANTQM